MLSCVMKIKVIFQNALELSKNLSYTDVFQVKKTIPGVSAKNIHLQTTDAAVHPAVSRFTQLAESKVQLKTETAKQNYSGSNR